MSISNRGVVRSKSFAYGVQGYSANRIGKYNLAFLVSREMTLLLSAMFVRLPTAR
jgi:hypothetical protein